MSADDSLFRDARRRRLRAALVQVASALGGLLIALPLVAYGLFPPPRDPSSMDLYIPLVWLIVGVALTGGSVAMLASAFRSWRYS